VNAKSRKDDDEASVSIRDLAERAIAYEQVWQSGYLPVDGADALAEYYAPFAEGKHEGVLNEVIGEPHTTCPMGCMRCKSIIDKWLDGVVHVQAGEVRRSPQ
jgi:hypothetical protein